MKSKVSNTILFLLFSTLIYISAAQRKCKAGTFNRNTGREPCAACPRGEFNNKLGKRGCKRCPVGQSTVIPWSRGKVSCKKCPGGLEDCDFCRPGFFNPGGIQERGKAACSRCDSGTASPGGESGCQTCDISVGQLTGGPGASLCMTCPETAIPNVNDFCVRDSPECSTTSSNVPNSCRLCQPGTTSRTGFEPCVPCEKGSFADGFGLKKCEPCMFDMLTPYSGARSMEACERAIGSGPRETRTPTPAPIVAPPAPTVCIAGQQAVGDGCIPCAAGTFKGSAGSSSCEACPKNMFQDEVGQVACKACEPGYITSGTGSTSCFYCPNDQS